MNNFDELSKKAISLAKLVLKMTTHAGSGHPSSALSLCHIITVLMYKVMRYDPKNPWNPSNDRLVLSEGHAVPIVYAAYADLQGVYGDSPDQKKTLSIHDLDTLRQINSPLDGHPNPSAGFPFFDCATGSLGQGISCGCGLALGAKMQNIDKRIFVIIGDGESREGQIWEACDFLIDNNLFNVLPIFNCNELGQTRPVSAQQSATALEKKLQAFGFKTYVINGHDPLDILNNLTSIIDSQQPSAIIAKTVKGWGVKSLQGEKHHGKPLKAQYLETALQQIDSMYPIKFTSTTDNHHIFPPKPPRELPPAFEAGTLQNPDFESLLSDDPYIKVFKNGLMSTRRAYGLALRELSKIDNRIIALDGDVSNSTFSNYLSKEFPERFFECYIAEQNMISTGCGLSAAGFVPFISTFAKFLVRGYDQLELATLSNANIKLCGSHSGANVGADGPSQMGLTDLGYMRTLSTVKNKFDKPLVTVFTPSDAVSAYKCVQLMANIQGICYIRTIREDLPIIYEPSERFETGGVKILREGSDIAIITCGYMVHPCIRIVDELADAGIKASLIDCYSLPVNPTVIINCAVQNGGKIVTVEDNYGNALGSEILSILNSEPSVNSFVKQLFVKRIPKSGLKAEDVLDFAGIGV